MTWTDFTEKEVSDLPKAAGVYALAISEHASRWVYVGETGSLRKRVMYHLGIIYQVSQQARAYVCRLFNRKGGSDVREREK